MPAARPLFHLHLVAVSGNLGVMPNAQFLVNLLEINHA